MNSLVDDTNLRALLDRLHAASEAQDRSIEAYYLAGADRPTGFEDDSSPSRRFWRDKFVALERDKAELCYSLCRAGGARRIVEAGTSFGVSTLYLAAGVRDNGGGLVSTCDNEPTKVSVAQQHFLEAGLAGFIDVRLGDIRETLAALDGPIDMLLLDIWAPIAGDVITLVGPHMPVGGIVVADNTTVRRGLYESLFEYLDDTTNGFTTMTLPYHGGLELAVKTG